MKRLKRYQLILISLLGGLLFSLAWPRDGLSGLLFIALLPFLFVEYYIMQNKERFSAFAVFFYVYPGFFLWNLLTTWWIYYASLFGAVMAVVFNALFMALVFQIFHVFKKILYKHNFGNSDAGYFILVVLWLTFEYFHLNWELSWPWLQLGNGFASSVRSVQWYEYTGVMGGSLWVLLVNILLFKLLLMIFQNKPFKQTVKFSLVLLALLIIPLIISIYRYHTYTEPTHPVNVLSIQPNVDPYGEKFIPEFREQIWQKLLGQTIQHSTPATDFIIWPETSIPGSILVELPSHSESIKRIRDSIKVYAPQAVLVTGADCYEIYDEKKTPTARYFKDGECCWDSYNSALEIDSSGLLAYYHKSKLVPGVERMPYPQVFGFLEQFAIDLGGSSGSMGMSEEPVVFTSGKVPVAPVICYESVYGDYLAKYIRKGAQLIFIITNDGWWDDTPGYRQHFVYARLRAIETRRSIARSANTGISGFINQRGDILQSVPFWEQHAISENINANEHLTVYARFGDYLGRISAFASLLIFLVVIVRKISTKKEL